ncbi:MAG: hypothetical protein HPY57_16025 [Ignavibacteria bacterium]|nr:hypothetical protein [Ignavibacteria bacterium]
MNQFIHVETKEIVRIMSDEGNFYILNNGMKIDKQLFAQKYAAVNSNQSMDAESFLNQKTLIQVNPPKQQIVENVAVNSGPNVPVDPIDFLNPTSSLANIKGIDGLMKIDTSKYVDAPESQRVVVRDLSAQEQQNPGIQVRNLDNEKQTLLEKYKHMGTNIQANFVDENDDKAVDQLVKNLEKPQPKVVLNENGLTETQEIFRQQQIELTGKDPYEDKIRKYRISKGYQNIEPLKNPKVIVDETVYPYEQNATQVTVNNITQQQIQGEDPTIAIFKKFKRNHNVTIKLEIKDKISKPDFIKVIADGFEGDIIQFYADELFKTFLDDFKNIKKEIYNQLYKNIYGYLPDEEIEKENQNQKRAIKNVPKNKKSKLNENIDSKEDTIVLIPGKPTKTGKLTFKYLDKKGKVIDMIPEIAESKGYIPAKESDIK